MESTPGAQGSGGRGERHLDIRIRVLALQYSLAAVQPGGTVKAHRFSCTVLCVLLAFFSPGCLQPIATEVLRPRLHPRDPDRAAVTFVALCDIGESGLVQSHVSQ